MSGTATPLTIGHGSVFSIGSGTTTITYTVVDGVTDITPGSSKQDVIDNTDLGTTGIYKVYVGGLITAGDYTLKINWIPGDAGQEALYNAFTTGGLFPFKVQGPPVGGTVPTDATATFSALVVSCDKGALPDDKRPAFSAKLQISGAITWA